MKNYILQTFVIALLVSLVMGASCATKKAAHTVRDMDVIEMVEKALQGGADYAQKFFIKLQPVHFPTAGFQPQGQEFNTLKENTKWLMDNPNTMVILEGHCDERGGNEYNLKLGDLRARSIKSYLVQNGITADRFGAIVSHGEERPVAKEHTHQAWQKNRRVEFIIH
ncbi:MAG: OmpA family protein [Pseudomonadota bacterium]